MNELNNLRVTELQAAELLKIEGGRANLIMLKRNLLNWGAFAVGFVVGFVDELAS